MEKLPAVLQSYLSYAAPKGEMLGYFIDAERNYWVAIVTTYGGKRAFSFETFPEDIRSFGHEVQGTSYDDDGMRRALVGGFTLADPATIARIRELLGDAPPMKSGG